MKLKNLIISVFSAGALMGASAAAHAGEALIQGVGFWGDATPATEYSAPDESFQFSFDVPETLDANPTTEVTDFFYSLNGAVVTNAVSSVEFYTVADNGMFDLVFPSDTISIYGADIGSTGTIAPSGFYDVTAGVDEAYPGTAEGGVTISIGAAPEPSSWLLMIVGIGGIGLVLRRAMTGKDPVEDSIAA